MQFSAGLTGGMDVTEPQLFTGAQGYLESKCILLFHCGLLADF